MAQWSFPKYAPAANLMAAKVFSRLIAKSAYGLSLIGLACVEISAGIIQEFYFKKKRKWVSD